MVELRTLSTGFASAAAICGAKFETVCTGERKEIQNQVRSVWASMRSSRTPTEAYGASRTFGALFLAAAALQRFADTMHYGAMHGTMHAGGPTNLHGDI